jgi:hypothetical protein
MSFLLAAPQELANAASDLGGLGSTISTANAAASASTTALLPAAADEVSTQIATLFSAHGQGYQQLSAQAAAFHEQFVQALTASANTYATAETNAAQTLLNTVNAPAATVLGHPLIGGSASASASSVTAGNAGSLASTPWAASKRGGNGATADRGSGSGLLGGSGGAIEAARRTPAGATGGGQWRASAGALPRPVVEHDQRCGAPAAFGSIATGIENICAVPSLSCRHGWPGRVRGGFCALGRLLGAPDQLLLACSARCGRPVQHPDWLSGPLPGRGWQLLWGHRRASTSSDRPDRSGARLPSRPRRSAFHDRPVSPCPVAPLHLPHGGVTPAGSTTELMGHGPAPR